MTTVYNSHAEATDRQKRRVSIRRYDEKVFITTADVLEPGHIYEYTADDVIMVVDDRTTT